MRLPPDGKRPKPYTGWDDRHHSFIDKLLQVLESSKVTPFAYGVSINAWENRSDFWKRIFVGPGFGKGKAHDPLFLSFQIAVSKTVTYCKPGKKMHFVYDLDPNAPLRDEYKRALCHHKSLDDFWLFNEPRLRC